MPREAGCSRCTGISSMQCGWSSSWWFMSQDVDAGSVRIPAPTAWPIVLAFGVTLIFAGLVTSEAVTVVGAALSVLAAVGWFRDVLPEEAHETVRVGVIVPPAATHRRVARVTVAQRQRAWLPLAIYPVTAG